VQEHLDLNVSVYKKFNMGCLVRAMPTVHKVPHWFCVAESISQPRCEICVSPCLLYISYLIFKVNNALPKLSFMDLTRQRDANGTLSGPLYDRDCL
jgi:hypothetical protein